MFNWLKKTKFWHTITFQSLSLEDNFPGLVYGERHTVKYTFKNQHGYAGSAIAAIVEAIYVWATTTTVLGVSISTIAVYAAVIGTSLFSSMFAKNKKPSTIGSGGLTINGRMSTDPLRIIYGRMKTGMTWIFWKTISKNATKRNDYLWIVATACESEIEGIDKDLEQPNFSGIGLNDCISSGTYSGATFNKFKVQIDGNGTPDTIKISDDGGSTWLQTGVPITSAWNSHLQWHLRQI